MQLNSHTLARLASQISHAGLVLFTGAGFSCAALDRKGRPLPSVSELKREIWDLCFAASDFDSSTPLGDLFEVAMKRNKADLETLLNERLTVDTDSLPDFYETYFDLPWCRCYTLNVDDFCRLHSEHLSDGKEHAGIIVIPRQRYSIGEKIRHLMDLINSVTAEEMRNRLEFL